MERKKNKPNTIGKKHKLNILKANLNSKNETRKT